jgi:hypothetical protein
MECSAARDSAASARLGGPPAPRSRRRRGSETPPARAAVDLLAGPGTSSPRPQPRPARRPATQVRPRVRDQRDQRGEQERDQRGLPGPRGTERLAIVRHLGLAPSAGAAGAPLGAPEASDVRPVEPRRRSHQGRARGLGAAPAGVSPRRRPGRATPAALSPATRPSYWPPPWPRPPPSGPPSRPRASPRSGRGSPRNSSGMTGTMTTATTASAPRGAGRKPRRSVASSWSATLSRRSGCSRSWPPTV